MKRIYQNKGRDIVAKAWKRFSDLKAIEIKKIPEGFKNQSYYIKDSLSNQFVMKIYALNFLNDSILTEYSEVLFKLFQKDVPVIEVVPSKTGRFLEIIKHNGIRYQVTVSRFVEVSNFDDTYLNKMLIEEIVKCLVNLHKGLNGIKVSQNVRVFKPIETLKEMLEDKTLIKIKDYFVNGNMHRPERLDKYLDQYVKDGNKILKYFEKRKKIFQNNKLIHGDFNLSNLNIKNNKINRIFDFDEMTLAPLTFEIGCSIVHLDEGFMFTEDLIEYYIKKYAEFVDLSSQDIEDILMFMQYRAYYRISRWFTYYRFSTNKVEHYSKYQKKLDKYKLLNNKEMIAFIKNGTISFNSSLLTYLS